MLLFVMLFLIPDYFLCNVQWQPQLDVKAAKRAILDGMIFLAFPSILILILSFYKRFYLLSSKLGFRKTDECLLQESVSGIATVTLFCFRVKHLYAYIYMEFLLCAFKLHALDDKECLKACQKWYHIVVYANYQHAIINWVK